ncbi:TetR family transcriptional regulator [Streptomyces sp. S1D4-11]
MPSKRRYVSPLREQAAARTRALILGQATELFAEHGYGRVTVADIASAAWRRLEDRLRECGEQERHPEPDRRPGCDRLWLRAGHGGPARPADAGVGPESPGPRHADG